MSHMLHTYIYNREHIKKATDVIWKLCINSLVFNYIVELGVIDRLVKIEKSTHLRFIKYDRKDLISTFRTLSSGRTLEFLLDFDLSHKYSFYPKSCLSVLNRIGYGFVDFGFGKYNSINTLAQLDPEKHDFTVLQIRLKPETKIEEEPEELE